MKDNYTLYMDRILHAPAFGFVAGHEILYMVRYCALHDDTLTELQYNNIIRQCELAHIKMMEDNYNGMWNH